MQAHTYTRYTRRIRRNIRAQLPRSYARLCVCLCVSAFLKRNRVCCVCPFLCAMLWCPEELAATWRADDGAFACQPCRRELSVASHSPCACIDACVSCVCVRVFAGGAANLIISADAHTVGDDAAADCLTYSVTRFAIYIRRECAEIYARAHVWPHNIIQTYSEYPQRVEWIMVFCTREFIWNACVCLVCVRLVMFIYMRRTSADTRNVSAHAPTDSYVHTS